MTEGVEELQIEVRHEGTSAVVAVSGEVDIATAPELEGGIDEALETGATTVVIDASGIDFIDSSGLRVLLRARTRLTDGGGELQVRNPSPAVTRVFEVSGLAEAFPAG